MQHSERPLLAILLRLLSMVLLSTMFMLVKYTSERGVAAPEIMFWRQAVTLPVIIAWLAARGELGKLRTRRAASHAARAALGTAAMFCNFGAAILLPLAVAITLGFTTPLFAVILTAIMLREHVGPWRWISVVLGFAGVLIIAQPGGEQITMLGAIAGLLGGLLVALVSFQIRDLARTDDAIACVFYFAVFGAAMTALLLPVYMEFHDPVDYLLLISIGLVGTLGQLLITQSLRFGSVATVIVMDYTALIWATLYGWLIWDQLPDLVTWLGAPAIIAAGLIITWRERRLARSLPLPSALDAD